MSRRGNATIRTSISIGKRIVNSFSKSDARSAQLSQGQGLSGRQRQVQAQPTLLRLISF